MNPFWLGLLIGWASTLALFLLLIWCLSRLRGWGEPVRHNDPYCYDCAAGTPMQDEHERGSA